MAKKKQANRQRPFRPNALDEFAESALRPRMGPGETLWRYSITVPLEEIRPIKRQKATLRDLDNLEQLFLRHFGGFTRFPNAIGHGLRDPDQPEVAPEMNVNTYFTVLASPISRSDVYFRALREELETALDEGVILVERVEVWIP
jgi:hypothetical protein